MANQVIVTKDHTVQISVEPTPQVQVSYSRAAISTVTNVETANYANFAGNVVNSNQPNITNVGTLGNLTVSSNATIGNLQVLGNLQVGNLFANNANYANFAGQAFNVNAANITGTVANSNYSAYAGQANTANLATFATTANTVAGANVTGVVGNANHASYANLANTANSVNVSNVVGIGNIATTNYDGNANHVLYGNGGFYALPTISNVANANYANFAGQVVNNTQSNITTVGTLTNVNTSGGLSFTQNNALIYTSGTVLNITSNNLNDVTGVYLDSATDAALYAYNNVVIQSNSSGTTHDWTFGVDGNLSTPGNIGMGGGVIRDLNNSGLELSSSNRVTMNHDDVDQVTASSSGIDAITREGNVTLQTYYNNYIWNFDNTGNTQFPANSIGNLGYVVNANYFVGDGSNLSNITAGNISGTVANANYSLYSNIANTANLATFATTANSVAGANVSGQVANANYALYSNIANSANSVAGANVSGTVANANYSAFSNVANSANSVAGSNVSGTVANANYAAYAGNVTIASQGNITTVGNLLTLNVINATSNSTQFLFSPNGTNVGVAGQNTASFIINQFTTQGGVGNQVLNMQFNAARGNITNPANVANSDYIGSMSWNSYNGNTYVRNARITVLAPQGGDSSLSNANVAWSAGSFFINTGNPFGNVTSNTASSSQNILQFNRYGSLLVNPGAPGPNAAAQTSLTLISYGANTDGAGSVTNRILFQRARGNRDSNQSVQNGDGIGGFYAQAYGNGAFSTVGGASMYVQVDTTFGNITANFVPMVMAFTVGSSNGTQYTTSFRPDGNILFPGGNSTLLVNSLNIGAVGGNNPLLKVSGYTAANLRAITGSVGQMAAVFDSSQGSNPNGMIAFWDTTNSRWSYIHDNSAV